MSDFGPHQGGLFGEAMGESSVSPDGASTNGVAPDEKVRQIIRGHRDATARIADERTLRLDANMIVSAGAGSGKTSLLIERMIVLIRSGVPVDELVAITFTRKAAGELQERFFSGLLEARAELQERIQSEDGWTEELQRIEKALQSSEEAYIGTIHSFCARILRLFPAAAGLPADFQQIEEADELVIRRRFWQQALAEAGKRTDEHLAVLREMEVPDSALFQFFSAAVEMEGVEQQRSETPRPEVAAAFEHMAEALKRLTPQLPKLTKPDAFLLAVERILLLLDTGKVIEDAERIQIMELLVSAVKDKGTGAFDIGVRAWGKKATPTGTLAYDLRDGKDDLVGGTALLTFVRESILPITRQWQAWLHDHVLAGVMPIVEAYREERIRLGQLTYDDLLREAGRVVTDNESVRSGLQSRFTHILVDEFQDTDPEQAALLFSLCAVRQDPSDWRRNVLIPGSLFVVGDDKQSIYRFRKADFQAFHTVCEAIEGQGGLHLTLSANFRSDARICRWVNEAIAPQFAKDGAPYQATWQDLEPFKGALHDGIPVRRLAIDKQQGGRSDMPRTVAEGRAIAEMILRENAGSFGDWMILVRNHTRVPLLMRMLTDAGIPVALEGGKGDKVADTIAVVHDLLACLVNPSDHVSLVAVLSGMWFGITDAELLAYRSAGGQWEQWMTDVEDLDGIPASIVDASTRLRAWSALIHAVPPLVAFEQILSESGLAGCMQRRMDGNVAVGMLEMIGELIADMQQSGMHMAGCVRELGRYRRGDLDLELFSDNVPYRDSVRIMTVHGSKGLQAPRVILADVSPNKEREPERHVWREGPRLLGRAPVRTQAGRYGRKLLEPAGWPEAIEQEARYAASEEMRLLYVAATRAQEHLVVCTHVEEGKGTWDVLIPALQATETPVEEITPTGDDQIPGFAVKDSLDVQAQSSWADPSDRIKRLSLSHWRVRRPSDHERGDERISEKRSIPASGDDGRGRRFGSTMHMLFEALAARRKEDLTRKDVDVLAQKVLGTQPELDDGLKETVTGHLWRFLGSDVWTSLQCAERVLTEVPFTSRQLIDGEEVLSSGIVDLAFRKGTAWTIVDYKTDRADEKIIRERHEAQVSDYVQAWKSLFGTTDIRGLIWSTTLDCALEIPSTLEDDAGDA